MFDFLGKISFTSFMLSKFRLAPEIESFSFSYQGQKIMKRKKHTCREDLLVAK